MNLVVDLGNTFFKLALFKREQLFVAKSFKKKDLKAIKKFIQKQHKIDSAIVSSVVSDAPEFNKLLKGIKRQILFSSQTKIPLKNLYKTPKTLGNDRLAAAVGGFK